MNYVGLAVLDPKHVKLIAWCSDFNVNNKEVKQCVHALHSMGAIIRQYINDEMT